MGLMEQFSKTPRKPSGLAGILSEAKRIGGDDPRAAVQRLADSGAVDDPTFVPTPSITVVNGNLTITPVNE